MMLSPAAAVFCFSTMENDIFIAQPLLPPNDSALVTNSVVSCSAGLKQSKLNELHSSTSDADRVFNRFFRVTMIEAALNESPSTNENKSGLGKGQAKSGTFPRAKRNLIGPYSSKNGGEQAIASSLHRITFLKVKTIAEAPPVRRNQKLTSSIDRAITFSARRSFEKLTELSSSKNGGERALSRSPHHSTSTKE